MPTKKKKTRSGGIASFQRMVSGNKSLKAAKKRLAAAERAKKAAYKKAVALAKKKTRAKSRRK